MENYLVVCKLGRFTYDVELLASSPERAAKRAEMSLRFARCNFEAKFVVLSVVGKGGFVTTEGAK